MRKIVTLILALTIILSLCACGAADRTCSSCSSSFSVRDAIYCPHCGEALPNHPDNIKDALDSLTAQTDSQEIIGTWQHTDSSWGLFEYTFYSDGFCKGTYITDRVSGVRPSLFPDSMYEGSGDGYWSFVDNMLKIEYIGEEKGTQYYKYTLSGDELVIYGEPTYSSRLDEPATWTKIN